MNEDAIHQHLKEGRCMQDVSIIQARRLRSGHGFPPGFGAEGYSHSTDKNTLILGTGLDRNRSRHGRHIVAGTRCAVVDPG